MRQPILFITLLLLLTACSNQEKTDATLPALPQIPDREVSITQFGASADSNVLCTQAFEAAIAHLDSLGGGTLTVPAGTWHTGPLVLCSHLRLQLQDGAVLYFAPDMVLYKSQDELFGNGQPKRQAPIVAWHATDIAITGNGTIDGSGDHWRPVRKEYCTDEEWSGYVADTVNGILVDNDTRWTPISLSERAYCQQQPLSHNGQAAPWQQFKNHVRPENVWLCECERVLLDGVTFRNSPMWNVHPELCRDLTIRHCIIQNEPSAANGDGLDMESCSHVYVTECSFDVGDDAICLKSGKDAEGRKRGRATEDVLIEDCLVRHAHGGFVVGSEMSGGVKDITVRRCTFEGTDSGLRFKTNRQRGGLVENITVEDITMRNILADALLFDMYYRGQSPVLDVNEGHSISDTLQGAVTESTPAFRGIHFRHIECESVGRTFYFDGLHESPICDITIDGLHASASAPSLFSECHGIQLHNIHLSGGSGATLNLYNVTDMDDPDGILSQATTL